MNAVRGGSAWNGARICRSACRDACDPWDWFNGVGFRTKAQPTTLVVRGGSWLYPSRGCRAACRNQFDLGNRRIGLGFRSKA